MFLDTISLTLQAGKGGDGCVHFARIKYQPFAGPDGGDGGHGGSVVLVADRNIDSLYHLRTANTTAPSGAPGAGNLKIGASATDLEIAVPVGTTVTDTITDEDLAELTAAGQRMTAAQGGDGGKGNPKYATGRRRTPRLAEPGAAGETREVTLTYRLYCDTLLLEARGEEDWQLLPVLAGREPAAVDWDLYERKPRWLRLEHDFRKYDCGYLPFHLADGDLHCPLIEHVYWARHIFVNLCAVQDLEDFSPGALVALLEQQALRRIERLTIATRTRLQSAAAASTQLQFAFFTAGTPAHLLAEFLQQLTGGTV